MSYLIIVTAVTRLAWSEPGCYFGGNDKRNNNNYLSEVLT